MRCGFSRWSTAAAAILFALLGFSCGGGGGGGETAPPGGGIVPSQEVSTGAVVGRIVIDPTIPLIPHQGALPDLAPGESLEQALEDTSDGDTVSADEMYFFPLPEEVGLIGVLGAVIVDPGEEIGNSGPPQIGDLLTPIAITDDGTYAFSGVPATDGEDELLLVVEFFSAVGGEEGHQTAQAVPSAIRRQLIKLVFPVGVEAGKVTRLDIVLRPKGPAVQLDGKRLLSPKLAVEVRRGVIDAAGVSFPRPETGVPSPPPSRTLPPDFPRDGFFRPDIPFRRVERKVIDRQRREAFNDLNGNGIHDPGEPLFPDPNLDGHPGFLVGFPRLIGPRLMSLRVVRPQAAAVDHGRELEIRLVPGFTRLIGIKLRELRPDRLVGVLVIEHRGELVARQIYPLWGKPPPPDSAPAR